MSISPPSDIILDVTRAADPARLREAAGKLDAAPPSDGVFEATLAAAKPATAVPAHAASPTPATPASSPTVAAPKAAPAAAPGAYRDFEAMVLANFFESAMPHDEVLFGSGTSGSVWKSVFVQEIAKSVAAKGGIGIADALARDGALTLRPAPVSGDVDVSRILLARLADKSTDSLWGSE